MGRTIPSFRIALAMEEEERKPFRNALDKKDRKKFDEMFDIPRLYASPCSYAVQPVRLYLILISILFHNYKDRMGSVFEKRTTSVIYHQIITKNCCHHRLMALY
jgi:hypothetical protein